MIDLRIFDYGQFSEEMGIAVDRIVLDLPTLQYVNDVIHKCLKGVYLKK